MREHIKLLLAICISCFLTAFMGVSLVIAMPFIAEDYQTSPESVTWMINSFTATTAACLLASSALADRFGYLKIFLIGAVSSAILSFGVALAPNLLLGSLARAGQGVTLALVFCTSMALVSQRIHGRDRTYAIGYCVACVYSGLSFSPIISGLIVDTIGWELMFYVTGVGLIGCALLAMGEPKDQPITKHLPFTKMAFSTLIGMLILFGISSYTSYEPMFYAMILGVALLVVYLLMEYKSHKPLLPIRFILSNKILCYALLASLFHYFGSFVYILLLGMHLQIIMGYSAVHTGIILLIQPMLMVVFSALAGKLAHAMGPQNLTLLGMFLCACSFVVLLFLEPKSGLSLIIASQLLQGVGFGLFSAPNTVIVMNSVDKTQYALTSAVQSISRTVGQATSMAVLTALMHYVITAEHGTTLYIRELSYSNHISFVISTCAFCVSLVFCVMCRHYRIQQVKELKAEAEQAEQVDDLSEADSKENTETESSTASSQTQTPAKDESPTPKA